MIRRNISTRKVLGAIALAGSLCGCAAGPFPEGAEGPGANGNTPDGNANTLVPDEDTVLVRFVNETDVVVEAEFYVSDDLTEGSAQALFVPDYLVTEGVGVAGTGLLIPRSADTVEWPCREGLVLGVAGGRFLDRDTGEELGTGTARVVQEGLVFDCGATITFTYQEAERGFTVTVDHE